MQKHMDATLVLISFHAKLNKLEASGFKTFRFKGKFYFTLWPIKWSMKYEVVIPSFKIFKMPRELRYSAIQTAKLESSRFLCMRVSMRMCVWLTS